MAFDVDSITNARQLKWDTHFLQRATLIAKLSKDPSMKVGAVLVGSDRVELGNGYNGFPRGVEDLDDWLNHRPTKYMTVVHAEMNAILNSTVPLRLETGTTLYCSTGIPCPDCMKHIIQVGIKRVVFPPQFVRAGGGVKLPGQIIDWDERSEHSKKMCEMAGVVLWLVPSFRTEG